MREAITAEKEVVRETGEDRWTHGGRKTRERGGKRGMEEHG